MGNGNPERKLGNNQRQKDWAKVSSGFKEMGTQEHVAASLHLSFI